MLFEIASWGVPSVLIPITHTNMDHQRKNAFNYARAGACSVIEETNMTANILAGEIERISADEEEYKWSKKESLEECTQRTVETACLWLVRQWQPLISSISSGILRQLTTKVIQVNALLTLV
jgi:UDP-N-acetylglucosamine:LPS N-acetylglucosamine transferase